MGEDIIIIFLQEIHLGSIWVIIKDESTVSHISEATIEVNQREQSRKILFTMIEAVNINSPIFDHTGKDNTSYSVRLNGSSNERFGLAKS